MRPEPRADRLEERDQLARLEVLGAVERHVLEEVREPALIGSSWSEPTLTASRSDTRFGRAPVAADVVAQAVGELPVRTAGSTGSSDRARRRPR